MNTLISFLIFGTLFSTAAFKGFDQTGTASYYANSLNGRRTASGKTYYKDSLVCAHKTLKLGTVLRVTNIKNDSVVYVTVIDRMGKSSPHIIDLSMAGAQKLNFWGRGTAKVRVEEVLPETIQADSVIKTM